MKREYKDQITQEFQINQEVIWNISAAVISTDSRGMHTVPNSRELHTIYAQFNVFGVEKMHDDILYVLQARDSDYRVAVNQRALRALNPLPTRRISTQV